MLRIPLHFLIFLTLTILTQIGGLAWLISLLAKRRLLTFLFAYGVLTAGTVFVAPLFGRVPLNCWSSDAFRLQSSLYCVLNRNYVSRKMRDVTKDLSAHLATRFPGTVTLGLDSSFPFFDGFPLLPHLSHDDGNKLDLAFYYRDKSGYLPGKTTSPIGYFDFEEGFDSCPQNRWSTRWNLSWLQWFWPDYQLERQRTKAAVTWLANDPRVEKIFLEPHLRESLDVRFGKVRFQGCFAARHDDHIHFQVH